MIDVLLTFDFDAESPWPLGEDSARGDLTQLSWGAYGARRGVQRIGTILDAHGAPATIFVPGWTAEAHPEEVRELRAGGHEIAHHGYHHRPPVELSAAEQRADLVAGIEAIERCAGAAPRGYRSPSWQLTPETLALLAEHGFAYDSSCMGDDRPYMERHGVHEILELPVSWWLDDFPHLGWLAGGGGPLRDPEEMFALWRREVELAIAEARPLVLTCHPEVSGRPAAAAALDGFVAWLAAEPRVRLRRCADLAESVSAQ